MTMSNRVVLLTSKTRRENGQALLLIALSFVALLAFTGLVVDVARVFVARANLRRAVDAAGLSATGQFRTGATGAQIIEAAINLIRSHDIADPQVVIETCNLDGTTHNLSLCPPPGKPARKLVHVSAKADVPMVFLQLVGIPTVSVDGESVAEAAAVDAVLILDTSESQAYDPPSGLAYTGDPLKGCRSDYVGADNVNACIAACNDPNNHAPCYPLQKIKDAAKAFVDRMYQDYDRVAVVSYARNPKVEKVLGTNLSDAKNKIDAMRAYDSYPGNPPGTPCPYASTGGERWKCGSSNPGGALLFAIHEFAHKATDNPAPPSDSYARMDSLPVAIFLSSGGLNATDPIPSDPDPDIKAFGYCPPKNPSDPATRDNPPPCRDQRWSVHHPAPTITTTSPLYDAEDYAYDWATFLGTPADEFGNGGMGVLIYSIALGQKAVCTTGADYSPGPPVHCANWNPLYVDQGSGLPNTGELFLRYVAAIGDDGNPATDPCAGAPSGNQCGNYYFAPSGNDLLRIFLEIAGRIFTRIAG